MKTLPPTKSMLNDHFILSSSILHVIDSADKMDFPHTDLDGKRGLTAVGVCFALGFGGSIPEVYDILDYMVEEGFLKRGITYIDSVYYV